MYQLCMVLAVMCFQPVTGSVKKAPSTRYKCLVQMTNYMGEGAYIVVSLVDGKGAYEKTLYVMGSNKKWYPNLKAWHSFYAKHAAEVSAVTGASVTGGDRSVVVLDIDDAKINSGYKLRFETAVEDNKYYEKDLEIPLTTGNISGKTDGTGYIRYVRLSAN